MATRQQQLQNVLKHMNLFQLKSICRRDRRVFRGFSKLKKQDLINFMSQRYPDGMDIPSRPRRTRRSTRNTRNTRNRQPRTQQANNVLNAMQELLVMRSLCAEYCFIIESLSNEIELLELRLGQKPPLPQCLVNEIYELREKAGEKVPDCSVCYESISREDCVLTACAHKFCRGCYTQFRKPECPQCRSGIRLPSV